MTTSIKVTACCSDDEQVIIEITDGDDERNTEALTLNNGDEKEVFVYGDRQVSIKELPKQ